MKKLLLMIGILFLFASVLNAQELKVEEIVQKANLASYYAGDNGLTDVLMTIEDAQGRKRIRDFRILRMDVAEGKEQKFYVYFRKPSDVAQMTYMVHKNIGKDDDRWLYLPALDLVRRVAASDKRSSFVGSHFVYEDVSGRGLEADNHELIDSSDDNFYKIKNTPKETKGVEFSYYYVWVRKDNFLVGKAEYYDSQNKLMRSIEVLDIKEIKGFPTVVKSLAKDFVRGGQTMMEFQNSDYNIGLTADIFEERYLRRAPAQWIK